MAEIIRLDKEAESIQYLCRKDKRLAKVIQMVGTHRVQPLPGQLFFYSKSDYRPDALQ